MFWRKPNLDHGVALDVILKALELKVKHGREGLEHETLLGVLKAITLSMVLVLALHHFNGDKVLERLVEILHPLDIQLDIYKGEQMHEL